MSDDHPNSGAAAKAILEAFNARDLDKIMGFFAEGCSLDMPRGAEPWGKRLVGKAAVRVRGCDHCEFRDGKVVRKDSYWKLVEPQ